MMEGRLIPNGKLGAGPEKLVIKGWCDMAKAGYIKAAAGTGKSSESYNITKKEKIEALKHLEVYNARVGFGLSCDGVIILNDGRCIGVEVKKGESPVVGDNGIEKNFIYHIVSGYYNAILLYFGDELINDEYSKNLSLLKEDIKKLKKKYSNLYNKSKNNIEIEFLSREFTKLKKVISNELMKDPDSKFYKSRWAPLEGFKDRRK